MASMPAVEQIRRRIERGILPITAPMRTATVTVAQWQPCDGCDELIGPRQMAYAHEYAAPPRVLRLHRTCHNLWLAECHRLAQRPPAPTTRAGAGLKSDAMTCAVCRQPIAARQNLLFRTDGRVEHVSCSMMVRKPLARRAPEPAGALICLACGKPIEPAQSIVKDEADLLHARCFVDRPHPISGGGALSAWTLVGDEHIGRHLGTTRAGHQDFMVACADVRRAAAAVAARARRVVAASRAARRPSVA
jgi:hypothetical protein